MPCESEVWPCSVIERRSGGEGLCCVIEQRPWERPWLYCGHESKERRPKGSPRLDLGYQVYVTKIVEVPWFVDVYVMSKSRRPWALATVVKSRVKKGSWK